MTPRGPRHHFACRLVWTGHGPTTNYRSYSREVRIDFDGKPSLAGSAAPAFRGDGARHNPEDLLVAALSSCHCLSYLAVCARAGIDVAAYDDEASGTLALHEGVLRFERVVLRPRVSLRGDGDAVRAERFHDEAHAGCFIARSMNFPVFYHPSITVTDQPSV
ncbi:MAG: OsmC family protein [Myxococcota bacterium]